MSNSGIAIDEILSTIEHLRMVGVMKTIPPLRGKEGGTKTATEQETENDAVT